MMSAVDGKVFLKQRGACLDAYEETAMVHHTNAWLGGIINMEQGFASKAPLELMVVNESIERIDFIAPYKEKSFIIAIDPTGQLNWDSATIDKEHIITILTQTVSNEYLAFLQEKGISYLFGGEKEIDFTSIFERLYSIFNIQRLLVEGCVHPILNAKLIDELSYLSGPAFEGPSDITDLPNIPSSQRNLTAMEEWEENIWWLRYKMNY
jgi:2,5-diamino-6-(ribosylamino)-4(3H)-pyrimidinone 5'-phosphate reductase